MPEETNEHRRIELQIKSEVIFKEVGGHQSLRKRGRRRWADVRGPEETKDLRWIELQIKSDVVLKEVGGHQSTPVASGGARGGSSAMISANAGENKCEHDLKKT